MPIENSTEGTVNNTLDMFLTSPLKICGEVELRIHQHLMGRMHGLGDIVRVCSHQQSLAQCRGGCDDTCRTSSACRSAAMPRRACARDEEARRRSRAGGRGGLRSQHAWCPRSRTAGQHHALPRHRPQAVQRQRQRQDDAARLGRRHRSPGALHRLLGPLARIRHQHDAHRVAPLAPPQVGLRVLHRRRRPRRPASAEHRAGRAEEAVVAVPGAGIVSERGTWCA